MSASVGTTLTVHVRRRYVEMLCPGKPPDGERELTRLNLLNEGRWTGEIFLDADFLRPVDVLAVVQQTRRRRFRLDRGDAKYSASR
jgi:hypothetical protein